MWFLLLSDVFGSFGTHDEQISNTVHVLRLRMNQWFLKRKEKFPAENLTRPTDLTRKMIGDPSNRVLKLKGAECWSFLLFLRDTLVEAQAHLPTEAARLSKASDCLIKLVCISKESPCNMPVTAIEDCFSLYGEFDELTQHIEELLIPKRHLIFHMLERLEDFGNPEWYSNWYDEHLNKLLKNACRCVSQATFETSILQNMRYLLREEAKRHGRL